MASHDVAASTAQLVAASRVKADYMSKSQDRLETASRAVTTACKSLVRQVQSILAARSREEGEEVNWSNLGSHEFKVQEMEQQVIDFSTCKSTKLMVIIGGNSSIGEQTNSSSA